MTDKILYRVWPDGTVQEASEEPYDYMSDDFTEVLADSEEDADYQVHYKPYESKP